MNNKCPTCGSTYNITPQHVGRTFTCQRCQSALVVQTDGLQVAGSPVTQQPQLPAAPPQPPAAPADAYGDYEGGGGDYSRPVRRPGGPSPMVDFIMFRRMIVPIFIHIIFWFGVAAAVLISLIFPITMMMSPGGSVLYVVLIPIFLVFSLLYVRILCEMIFLPFRINETLTDILNELKRD